MMTLFCKIPPHLPFTKGGTVPLFGYPFPAAQAGKRGDLPARSLALRDEGRGEILIHVNPILGPLMRPQPSQFSGCLLINQPSDLSVGRTDQPCGKIFLSLPISQDFRQNGGFGRSCYEKEYLIGIV